ncbi:MAG: hypothetical protein ACRCWJ_10115 [Casimicrobium sp.]
MKVKRSVVAVVVLIAIVVVAFASRHHFGLSISLDDCLIHAARTAATESMALTLRQRCETRHLSNSSSLESAPHPKYALWKEQFPRWPEFIACSAFKNADSNGKEKLRAEYRQQLAHLMFLSGASENTVGATIKAFDTYSEQRSWIEEHVDAVQDDELRKLLRTLTFGREPVQASNCKEIPLFP